MTSKTTLHPRDLVLMVARDLGIQARDVSELPGGRVNHVWLIHTPTGPSTDVVVRWPRPGMRATELDVQEWCLRALADTPVPVPRLIHRGRHVGQDVLVESYVDPAPDHGCDPAAVAGLWRTLGRYAELLSQVVPDDGAPADMLSRFGGDLRQAWRAHVQDNVDALLSDDALVHAQAYADSDRSELATRVKDAGAAVTRWGLAHADLDLRNLVIPRDGSAPVLIDWGSAVTGPAPWHDLVLAYDRFLIPNGQAHLTRELLWAHAEGAGVDLSRSDDWTTLTGLHLLHRLDLARWSLDRSPADAPSYTAAARTTVRSMLA